MKDLFIGKNLCTGLDGFSPSTKHKLQTQFVRGQTRFGLTDVDWGFVEVKGASDGNKMKQVMKKFITETRENGYTNICLVLDKGSDNVKGFNLLEQEMTDELEAFVNDWLNDNTGVGGMIYDCEIANDVDFDDNMPFYGG